MEKFRQAKVVFCLLMGQNLIEMGACNCSLFSFRSKENYHFLNFSEFLRFQLINFFFFFLSVIIPEKGPK